MTESLQMKIQMKMENKEKKKAPKKKMFHLFQINKFQLKICFSMKNALNLKKLITSWTCSINFTISGYLLRLRTRLTPFACLNTTMLQKNKRKMYSLARIDCFYCLEMPD